MAVDIGPKIGIDGEKEFRQQLNDINTTLKTIGTEMKKVSSEFQENGNSQEALRKKNEVLNKTIDEQKKKLEMVQKALEESRDKFGETSTKTQQWQQVLNRTETALNNLEAELGQNEKALQEMDEGLRDVETGLKKVDDSAEDIKDIKQDFKDAAENGVMVLSGALAGLAAAFAGAAESSREYRTDQAKLQVAFEDAGYSAEQAKTAFTEIYGLLGEDDTSVEAANHLAELTDNEKELATWTGDILPGVFAKFGDSLPLEGLTEAANETAKVGTVTGSLADALNWAGISEDEFNEQLAKCSDEQERQQLITQTLADTYGSASTAFKETNAQVIEANKAQAELTDAIADLGTVAEPTITKMKGILTDFIKVITDVLAEFNELPDSAQNAVLAIAGIGIAAGPTIKGVTSVKNGISALGKGFKAFFSPAKTAAAAVGSVGTAATTAAGSAGVLSGAVSSLFGLIAAHPVGALITALGLLATGFGIAAAQASYAETEEGKFQQRVKESREEVEDYRKTMEDLAETRENTLAESESEMSYYQNLKTELDNLVDANGKVKEGYETRAQFITETLSDALGTEIEMTDGVIKNYGELTDSIDNLIEKKRAEAALSAYEAEYTEALKNQQEVAENLTVATMELDAAQEAYNYELKHGTDTSVATAASRLGDARTAMDEATAAYKENSDAIQRYEEMAIAMQEGNYEKMYQIAYSGQTDLTNLTREQARERIKAIETENEVLLDEYEKTGDETFKIMADANQAEIDQLRQHLGDMSSIIKNDTDFKNAMATLASDGGGAFVQYNFKKLGYDVSDGVAQGIAEKTSSLYKTVQNMAGNIAKWFGGTLDIHSPSRVMEDLAEWVPAGVAEGMIKGLPYIQRAGNEMTNAIKNIKIPHDISVQPIQSAPAMSQPQTPINVTVYSVLDGKIVSKSVQKDITKTQTAAMRAKGALV